LPLGKAARATRAVSSGTGSRTCGRNDMTDILLLEGWEHDRRRCSYYAIARFLGAFLDANRAVDIHFLLQKMFSVVSYTKKGDRQMQTKARHFHHSVYSTPPSRSYAETLYGPLKTNRGGSPTVSGRFLAALRQGWSGLAATAAPLRPAPFWGANHHDILSVIITSRQNRTGGHPDLACRSEASGANSGAHAREV
jgi:hypothetical protein